MSDVNGVNTGASIGVNEELNRQPDNGLDPQVVCKMGCHGIDYSGHRPATEAEIEMLTLIADFMPGPPIGRGIRAADKLTDKVGGLIEHLSPKKTRRYEPNTASFGNLPLIKEGDVWLRGTEMNAGRIPRQVAEKLSGQSFSSFGKFREAFWKEVASDPVLSKQLDFGDNLARMRSGKAPFAVENQRVGGRAVYEIDHLQEIQNGGNVFDMDNLIIRTPLNHIRGK